MTFARKLVDPAAMRLNIAGAFLSFACALIMQLVCMNSSNWWIFRATLPASDAAAMSSLSRNLVAVRSVSLTSFLLSVAGSGDMFFSSCEDIAGAGGGSSSSSAFPGNAENYLSAMCTAVLSRAPTLFFGLSIPAALTASPCILVLLCQLSFLGAGRPEAITRRRRNVLIAIGWLSWALFFGSVVAYAAAMPDTETFAGLVHALPLPASVQDRLSVAAGPGSSFLTVGVVGSLLGALGAIQFTLVVVGMHLAPKTWNAQGSSDLSSAGASLEMRGGLARQTARQMSIVSNEEGDDDLISLTSQPT